MKNFLMLRVLTSCNWKCHYCEYGHLTHQKIDDDLAIKIFEENKEETTHITGGEPGLLSEKFWDYVFGVKPLGVITNGTFIKRGYYEKYKDRITHLYIHAVQELDEDIDPEILEFVCNNKNPNFEISFVIHKHNIPLIKSFLEKYNDIVFNITMSGEQFSQNSHYHLDRESALRVIAVLKDFPRYSYFKNKLFLAIIRDNWNLCFMSKEKSCLTCKSKCWKHYEDK